MWAVSAFGGPLLSGAITEAISWRAAFLVNVPVILIFAGLVLIVVPGGGGQRGATLPPAGRLAAIACGILAVAVAGIVENGPAKAGLVVGAGALIAGAVALDRHRPARLFPDSAFRVGNLVGIGLWLVFLMPLAQAPTSVYVVLTAERLWGYGPMAAGAINAVLALSWSATAVAVTSIHGRPARRMLVGGGPTLLAVGLAAVAGGFAFGGPVLLTAGMAAIGAGFGASWGYLSQFVMEAASAEDRDAASALLPTVQSAGYAVGAAVAGLVANLAHYPEATAPQAVRMAATTVFAASTVIALLAVGAGFQLMRLDKEAKNHGR